jgi:hypothetical protein
VVGRGSGLSPRRGSGAAQADLPMAITPPGKAHPIPSNKTEVRVRVSGSPSPALQSGTGTLSPPQPPAPHMPPLFRPCDPPTWHRGPRSRATGLLLPWGASRACDHNCKVFAARGIHDPRPPLLQHLPAGYGLAPGMAGGSWVAGVGQESNLPRTRLLTLCYLTERSNTTSWEGGLRLREGLGQGWAGGLDDRGARAAFLVAMPQLPVFPVAEGEGVPVLSN